MLKPQSREGCFSSAPHCRPPFSEPPHFSEQNSNPVKPSPFYLPFSTGSAVAINGRLVQGNKAPLAGARPPRGALSDCECTPGTALDGSSLAGRLIAATPAGVKRWQKPTRPRAEVCLPPLPSVCMGALQGAGPASLGWEEVCSLGPGHCVSP